VVPNILLLFPQEQLVPTMGPELLSYQSNPRTCEDGFNMQ